jgi:hypothetical protein
MALMAMALARPMMLAARRIRVEVMGRLPMVVGQGGTDLLHGNTRNDATRPAVSLYVRTVTSA